MMPGMSHEGRMLAAWRTGPTFNLRKPFSCSTQRSMGMKGANWDNQAIAQYTLFQGIGLEGDLLGIPPYNGGLFAKDAAPLLQRVPLADSVIADLVFGLSHQNVDGELPREFDLYQFRRTHFVARAVSA
jgi:hypothetical protein